MRTGLTLTEQGTCCPSFIRPTVGRCFTPSGKPARLSRPSALVIKGEDRPKPERQYTDMNRPMRHLCRGHGTEADLGGFMLDVLTMVADMAFMGNTPRYTPGKCLVPVCAGLRPDDVEKRRARRANYHDLQDRVGRMPVRTPAEHSAGIRSAIHSATKAFVAYWWESYHKVYGELRIIRSHALNEWGGGSV